MSGQRMLIVGGDESNRRTLSGFFEGDFNIIQAQGQTEALALLGNHEDLPAIVLLDVAVATEGGLNVLQEMQREPRWRAIPVIVTALAGQEEACLKAVELGAQDYLLAPFHPALAKLRVKGALAAGEYERLRLLNEALTVESRENAGDRAQLIHTLNTAESASANKGEYMFRMSHEIRTPLNAIIGFVSLARNCLNDTKRVEEYLGKTEFASKHLLSIINDVLDMSAIEAGQMSISCEKYDLKELINAVTAIVYPPIHKKNIQFQIMLSGVKEEHILGDKLRTSQILLNLLSNAVKFTPQNGSIVLNIKQHPLGENHILMEFEIKDSGIGMSREFLQRLGKPFEQQDSGIAQQYGGSGLGLSITKHLVSLMHGTINIESAEGQGSVFTVSLPVDVERSDLTETKSYTFAQVNALVIDRDEAAAEYTRLCFRSLGCRCDSAVSGRQALALCQKNNYNLVLMDWKLPDLDGWNIIEAIRQAVDNEPKIVIMAYDYTEISKDAAADLDFVNKPVFQSSILDLMLQLYGKYAVEPSKHDIDDFRGKRILLAEDNAMNLEIANGILTGMGFVVIPARDGRAAYEAFMRSAPGDYDLILMDAQMPVMNGYEATRRIRASKHPQAQSIPILAMSADAFAQDVAAALECGMDDHIAKPIDIDSLSNTIAKHILDK